MILHARNTIYNRTGLSSRGLDSVPAALRRRRLARYRYASLAAGGFLTKENEFERLNVSNSHGVVGSSIAASRSRRQRLSRTQFQIKHRIQIYNRANVLNSQRHNNSLNLTEIAVDELAARQATIQEHQADTSAQRSTWNWLHVAAG